MRQPGVDIPARASSSRPRFGGACWPAYVVVVVLVVIVAVVLVVVVVSVVKETVAIEVLLPG